MLCYAGCSKNAANKLNNSIVLKQQNIEQQKQEEKVVISDKAKADKAKADKAKTDKAKTISEVISGVKVASRKIIFVIAVVAILLITSINYYYSYHQNIPAQNQHQNPQFPNQHQNIPAQNQHQNPQFPNQHQNIPAQNQHQNPLNQLLMQNPILTPSPNFPNFSSIPSYPFITFHQFAVYSPPLHPPKQ
ncbi:MAG: hypothetical protein LBN01_05100 [Endomicrobium sp.]|jgi:cytochrome c-type biogenesis protein CcmH/NrfG|nr:hypothetical protein [Endomicrobium sp.]